jgi:DNA-binding transcriptional ArsR family regulator
VRGFMVEMFKAFGVESRIKIIELLKEKGPLGVNDLSEKLGITPSAVSQHLKVLRFAGLVKNQRQGCCVPYEVNLKALENCGELFSNICSCDSSNCAGMMNSDAGENVGNMKERLKRHEEALEKELEEVRNKIGELEKVEGDK